MASFSDTFTRANGALGGDYDTPTGCVTLNVISNQVGCSGLGQNGNLVRTSVAAFADDHEAEITVPTLNSFDFVGVWVRGSTSGNGYLAIVDGRNTGACRIERIAGGTRTSIGSVNIDAAPGDVLRLRAEGTTISAYLNDVLADSVTDTTYSSGQPGLYGRWEDSNVSRLDAFFATDLGGPPPPTQTPHIRLLFRPPA